MQQDILQYIIPLASVVIGSAITFLGVHLTNKNSLKQLDKRFEYELLLKRRDYLQNKGETLYKTIDDWASGFFSFYLSMTSAFSKDLPQLARLELERKAAQSFASKNIDFRSVEMNIKLYFSSLLPSYEDAMKKRGIVTKFITDNNKKESGTKNCVTEFVKAQKVFEDSIDVLKEKLIEQIRAI